MEKAAQSTCSSSVKLLDVLSLKIDVFSALTLLSVMPRRADKLSFPFSLSFFFLSSPWHDGGVKVHLFMAEHILSAFQAASSAWQGDAEPA